MLQIQLLICSCRSLFVVVVAGKGQIAVLIDIFLSEIYTGCTHNATLKEETDTMSPSNVVIQEKKKSDSTICTVLQE